MSVTDCFAAGLRRVLRSPAPILWLYLASVVIALPLAAAMRGVLTEAIGASVVEDNLRRGFDLDWYGEFGFQHTGFEATFGPSVVGILPVLSHLDRLIDGALLEIDRTVLAAGIFFLLAWAFFGGGIIARYAQAGGAFTRGTFFGISAEYFFRFIRLLAVSILLYLALYRWIGSPLFDLVDRSTRDETAEGTVMLYTMLVYLLLAALLTIFSLSLDYAKISMVVEQRRSALLALIRGVRFFLSNPLRTLSLYLLLALIGLLLIAAYGVIAPGVGQSTPLRLLGAFVAGQAFLGARLVLKLWFLASQTAFFQSAARSRESAVADFPGAPAAADAG